MKTIDELKKYLSTLQNVPEHYRIAVGSLIFTSDDKVLLIERGAKARDEQGKLEGVGGGLDDGEQLDEALTREIKEELGDDIEVEISDKFFVKVLPGNQGGFWVVVDFLCKLISGTPKIMEKDKVKAIHLLSLKDIDYDRLSVFQKVTMDEYREKFGLLPYYKTDQ